MMYGQTTFVLRARTTAVIRALETVGFAVTGLTEYEVDNGRAVSVDFTSGTNDEEQALRNGNMTLHFVYSKDELDARS